MRIGDLLKLRIDCIKPHLISGYTIEWTQHKGRKNKAPMPVRSECVAAIEKLIEITAELRDEADEKDKDTLMIWRVPTGNGAGQVMNLNSGRFNGWFKKFIKDNNIKDANGDYYNLIRLKPFKLRYIVKGISLYLINVADNTDTLKYFCSFLILYICIETLCNGWI